VLLLTPHVTHASSARPFDPLLSAWPEAVVLISDGGAVRTMNAIARRLLRLPDAPYVGSLSDLLGARAAAALVPTGGVGDVVQVGDDATPAGRPILRARSARLPDGDFLVRLDDVSEEHRLRSHLEHAERLASIGELLSSVAHELANPLTTVLGYADLLLAEEHGIPREEIERIRAEALRCRRIVGNLLDLSRAEAFEMRPLSLAQVVDKVIEFRTYAAQVAQVRLVREEAADLPAVQGDQHRLVQAILNLVTNAEDAVRDLASDRRVILRTRRVDGGATIEVEDNGPGVPAAIRDFVFEPFFTTKPRGRGTGLGLSLVRATALAHGGRIRIDDAPGGGARFVMTLPTAT
jgi:signal transduction histidine kinase